MLELLEFVKALSDLSSLRGASWRWWVSIALGIAGMIGILMNVQGDIAVLYVFLDLVVTIVVATTWEWRAQGQKAPRGGGKYKAK